MQEFFHGHSLKAFCQLVVHLYTPPHYSKIVTFVVPSSATSFIYTYIEINKWFVRLKTCLGQLFLVSKLFISLRIVFIYGTLKYVWFQLKFTFTMELHRLSLAHQFHKSFNIGTLVIGDEY